MTQNVLPPFPVFVGPDGLALDGAKVYIGIANADPLLAPKAVFFDAGLSVPAPQPLRTSGGLIWRQGSPTSIYTVGDYSILVRDQNNQTIYSAPSAQIRVTTSGNVVIPAGTSLSVLQGGAIAVADGATVSLGNGTGAGATVNVASTTRISGNLIPNITGRDLGNNGQRWRAFLETINLSDSAQPTALAGNLGSPNRRTATLALCRQTSSTSTAALRNIYNVQSINRFALGVYDVTLTVPVANLDDIVVTPTPLLNGVTTCWLPGSSTTSVLRLSFFDPTAGPPANIDTPFGLEVRGYMP